MSATGISGPPVVTTDGGAYGGRETVGIATDPAASRSITVTTGGGPLQIEPLKDRVP